jgi:hypothetical protein
MALEAEKVPFDANEKLKGKDMVKKSQESDKIEYTSPLYLANIMLCKVECDLPESHRPKP